MIVDVDKHVGEPERPDVFVSYAREDGVFAARLTEALERRGKEVWIDSEAIPKGAEWWERIEAGIEASRAVVFVLSPDFVASAVCAREADHAVGHSKRLLPIVRMQLGGARVRGELEAVNWVFFDDDARFDEAVGELVDALDTDLDWLDRHARLLVRALEWRRADERARGSLLLRGADLRAAEEWLAVQSQHAEQATPDQIEYVLAGRRASVRRHRATFAAVLGVLVLSIALSVFALVQRSAAIDRAKVAESQALAASALTQLSADPQAALELVVQAMHRRSTAEARDALRRVLPEAPVFGARFGPIPRDGWSAAFSPDGNLLVIGVGKTPRVLNLASRRVVAKLAGHTTGVRDVVFSPDGSWVVTEDARRFRVWRPRGGKPAAVLDVTPAPPGGTRAIPVRERHMFFSPTGRLFVTETEKGSIVWDTRTWRQVQTLSHRRVVAFSPNGRRLIVGDKERKNFDVRDTASWKSLVGPEGQPVAGSLQRLRLQP